MPIDSKDEKRPVDQYGKKEAKSRFEAALRGARAAAPQPMKNVSPKRGQFGDISMPEKAPHRLVKRGKRNI